MRFVSISEQTAIISLYIFNLLVSVTETESVYCAVRSKSLMQFSLIRLFSRRPGFDSRQVHMRFVMDKLVLGDRFVSKYCGFSPVNISPGLPTFFLCMLLLPGQGAKPQNPPPPPKKVMDFQKSGKICCKNTFI
jgi:hypothetical protein